VSVVPFERDKNAVEGDADERGSESERGA